MFVKPKVAREVRAVEPISDCVVSLPVPPFALNVTVWVQMAYKSNGPAGNTGASGGDFCNSDL